MSDEIELSEEQEAAMDRAWAPSDVYFGEADKPLPDWRGESEESDEDDDAPPSAADKEAVRRMLGFDPNELDEDTPPSRNGPQYGPKVPPSPLSKSMEWRRKEGSYFANCERDKEGRCLPSGQSGERAGEERPEKKETEEGRTGKNPNLQGDKPAKDYAPPPEGEKIVKAPCCLYDPNPAAINAKTGVADKSRVGVPAMSAPPPPSVIPRLPNLTVKEREAETRFANAYLANPDAVVAAYDKGRNTVVGHDDKGNPIYAIGDAPNIFNTDDAKLLSPDYNPKGASRETVNLGRGTYNAAVHQTANAIAKRSFLKYLDEKVKNLPEDQRMVLVTSGGVAAGKGYALGNVEHTKALAKQAAAVWDAAGEQNATENPWILEECKKRGIKAVFAFINGDPKNTWENPKRGVVERANRIGRMVDARLFADSYALGAKNFHAFHEKNKNDPSAQFFVIDNSKGATPELLDHVPEHALALDSDQLYQEASSVLESRAEQVQGYVVRGGTIGQRIWGKPPAEKRSEAEKYLDRWLWRKKAMESSPEEDRGAAPRNKGNPFREKASQIAEIMREGQELSDEEIEAMDEERYERERQYAQPFDLDSTKQGRGPKAPPSPLKRLR